MTVIIKGNEIASLGVVNTSFTLCIPTSVKATGSALKIVLELVN